MNGHIKALLLGTSMLACSQSHGAVDGCKLLLCLAGDWQNIAACTPTVKQAFADSGKGRPLPNCETAGAGNSARRVSMSIDACPPAYRTVTDSGTQRCEFPESVEVTLNGKLWSTVFWTYEGKTSTRLSAEGKAAVDGENSQMPDADETALEGLTKSRSLQGR
jgi:hypothetical protein